MIRNCIARIALSLLFAGFVAPLDAADVNSGRQLYNMHCASCHGPSGISVMPNAPNVARGAILMQPDVQLLGSIRRGKNAMPAYFGVMKDQEILDVIAYMRTLRQ